MSLPSKIRKKIVKVLFDNDVDKSEFSRDVFLDIDKNGLRLSLQQLIHCASIHFQSRFKYSPSRKIRAAYDTIQPLITQKYRYLQFSDHENSELQRQSSEVIAVGLAVNLMKRLFGISFSQIFNLQDYFDTAKRCDYFFQKNGKLTIFEAKGRKNNLNGAKKKIREQKSVYSNFLAKYGVLAHIPRDGIKNTSINVIDPEFNSKDIGKTEMIINKLIYYTKVVQLAGFWNLAKYLNKRIEKFKKNKHLVFLYDRRELELPKNIYKIGSRLTLTYENLSIATFFAPDLDIGLKFEFRDDNLLVFGLDPNLIDLLISQDFDKLLNYRYKSEFDNGTISIQDDGTFLFFESKERLFEV